MGEGEAGRTGERRREGEEKERRRGEGEEERRRRGRRGEKEGEKERGEKPPDAITAPPANIEASPRYASMSSLPMARPDKTNPGPRTAPFLFQKKEKRTKKMGTI
jgi:hypothetical protein